MGIPTEASAPLSTLPPWLEQSFRDHHQAVFRSAHRITGNPTDAEDVLQTVFVRLLRRADPPPGDALGAYLHTAAVHAALDVMRARRRAGWVPLEDARWSGDSVSDAERDDAGRRLRRGLREALARLSPRAAAAFALRYFEGHSNQQIATAIGTSPAVVAVLLHRTRARLRKDLAAWLGD
jgi:RNA polymerase sigma-70 factor (ECF subfamily)